MSGRGNPLDPRAGRPETIVLSSGGVYQLSPWQSGSVIMSIWYGAIAEVKLPPFNPNESGLGVSNAGMYFDVEAGDSNPIYVNAPDFASLYPSGRQPLAQDWGTSPSVVQYTRHKVYGGECVRFFLDRNGYWYFRNNDDQAFLSKRTQGSTHRTGWLKIEPGDSVGVKTLTSWSGGILPIPAGFTMYLSVKLSCQLICDGLLVPKRGLQTWKGELLVYQHGVMAGALVPDLNYGSDVSLVSSMAPSFITGYNASPGPFGVEEDHWLEFKVTTTVAIGCRWVAEVQGLLNAGTLIGS